MYNRYIPQPDGSYRRSHQPEPKPPARPSPPPPPPPEPVSPPRPPAPRPHSSGTGFLRQLLPKEFDGADLIIILLLLLMAGDSEDGRSDGLLTIALYLLM